ncbi:MAG TPA: CAP domain-containing protein [Parapedobacter sp.]|uniref:CAP domain-containing protein n=1 Tax=Parapedobacter sp. TaxID=1958893 RepID=UPI002C336C88|nr:CAP domain-containing protein [Parapedobacter sp.]HWK57311.1 CAP domain-containing protein [Parapedobacter sp.]
MAKGTDLENEIKIAQLDKLLAEKEKIFAEKRIIDLEYQENLKKSNKYQQWKQIIVTALIWVAGTGFYITYGILPAVNYNNEMLKLNNAKTSRLLFEKQRQIEEDSTKIELQIRHNDSVTLLLNRQVALFDTLNNTRGQLYSALERHVAFFGANKNGLGDDIEAGLYESVNKISSLVDTIKSLENKIPLEFKVDDLWFDQVANEIIELVNNFRTSEGKSSLKFDPSLQQSAYTHAQEMALGKVQFGHGNISGRLTETKLNDKLVYYGENVAMGNLTPKQVVSRWIKSRSQRENMLRDYNIVGVGISGSDSEYFFVLLLGKV